MCKLMSNESVYNKLIEKLRNIINIKLVKNNKDHLKCTSKLSYVSGKIIDINLVAIQKSKISVKLNKLAYIGMCILELSKELMDEFHYDYIKKI